MILLLAILAVIIVYMYMKAKGGELLLQEASEQFKRKHKRNPNELETAFWQVNKQWPAEKDSDSGFAKLSEWQD